MEYSVNSPPTPPSPATDAPPIVKKSRGERYFDWIVYGGSAVGTFLLTIPLAYWADHGRGQQFFDRCAAKLETFGVNPKNATMAVRTSTLSLGGTVMLVPVYVAETFHKPIVGWFNRHFGTHEDSKAIVQSPPPQSVATLLKGRAVAWGAVFGGFKAVELAMRGLGKPNALPDFETQFATKACELMGKPVLDAAGEETKLFRKGKIAAMDVFATITATILLYTSSHFFARHRKVHTPAAPVPLTPAPMPAPVAADLPHDASVPGTRVSGAREQAGYLANNAPAPVVGAGVA